MKNSMEIFRLLSDETRLRMLLLLDRKELCVCQLMAVLGVSQPLVSRNLSLLAKGGFLEDRRAGKLIFYRARRELDSRRKKVYDFVKDVLKHDETVMRDFATLAECTEFQKQTGRCDMETLHAFMQRKKKTVSEKRNSP